MESRNEHEQSICRHGLLLRLFALFVGFWMWMMPQMLNARAMATPDDYGSRPAPVSEEEETKHATAFHWVSIGNAPFDGQDGSTVVPHSSEVPVIAPHGEVPHPPPWH